MHGSSEEFEVSKKKHQSNYSNTSNKEYWIIPPALDVWTDFLFYHIFFSFSHVLWAQLAFHAIRFNKHTIIILFSIFSLRLKYTYTQGVYVYFKRREDINKKYYNCVLIESIGMEG